MRHEGKVEVIDEKLYHNEGSFNIEHYLTKKAYYARSIDAYALKWGKKDPDVKKQIGFYYRYFGVFFENKKWVRLAIHPAYTIGMYYLRVLVGLRYMMRGQRHENPS